VVLREPALPSTFWLSPLAGMLLWPLIFLLLDALRLGSWRRR
jgi:rod shape-determining protein MreD